MKYAIALLLLLPASAFAQEEAVAKIFAKRCAECHGADLQKPKKGIKVTIPPDAKLVTPGKPDDSPLWKAIRSNEMPPDNPMPDQEKTVIYNWIKSMGEKPAEPVEKPAAPAPAPVEQPVKSGNPLKSIGKFHVIAIHFPIALIFAALLAEIWGRIRPGTWQDTVVSYCIYMGAVSAVAACSLGFLYGMGRNVGDHQLYGFMGASLFVATALTRVCCGRSWQFTTLLVVTALVIGYAAHLGGALVHGSFL
jgi:uncharacterized membrane protein